MKLRPKFETNDSDQREKVEINAPICTRTGDILHSTGMTDVARGLEDMGHKCAGGSLLCQALRVLTGRAAYRAQRMLPYGPGTHDLPRLSGLCATPAGCLAGSAVGAILGGDQAHANR